MTKKPAIFRYEFLKLIASKRILVTIVAILMLLTYNIYTNYEKDSEFDNILLGDLLYQGEIEASQSDGYIGETYQLIKDGEAQGISRADVVASDAYQQAYAQWEYYDDAYFATYDVVNMVWVSSYFRETEPPVKDPDKWVEAMMIRTEYMLDHIDKGIISYSPEKVQDYERQYDLYKYMYEHEILDYNSPNEVNGLNFLVNLFKDYNILIVFAILAFQMMFSYTSENDNGTYKLLMSSPVSKVRLVIEKIVFNALTSVVIFAFTLLAGFIIASVLGGTGSLEYPQWISGGSVVSTGVYIGYIFITLILVSFLFSALFSLFSVFFSNFENAMIFVGFILIALAFMYLLGITYTDIYYIFPYMYVFPYSFALHLGKLNIPLLGVITVIHLVALVGLNVYVMNHKDFGDFSIFNIKRRRKV
ncbi:ABC transporter permease [Breznakia pachnodae]|uniref:ABC-type transport system involved in multi-copper enzyme maturation permease subunit n=1 Tax=Breznakia pachnodae TaxID=265178 RepID=A0ABU0E7N2_9FIRM|nr:ABC transporter permease subunit [Breznakia pachnodae]MDQ0362913.1 ABC-type transport system involved in multi-copper enzyme maturation permease subunit [Breznakia pachnodae]